MSCQLQICSLNAERELGFMVGKSVVSRVVQEASQWYTVLKGSLEQHRVQWDAIRDMISNTHSRDAC